MNLDNKRAASSNDSACPPKPTADRRPWSFKADLPHPVGLDVARVIACVSVIALHSGLTPTHWSGSFRMAFFSVLLAFLAAYGTASGRYSTFSAYAKQRATRLLLPLLLWMALYQFCHYRQAFAMPVSLAQLATGMCGPHLWFLSYAFCAALLAYGVGRILIRLPQRWRVVSAVALALLGAAWACVPWGPPVWPPKTLLAVASLWSSLGGAILVGAALAFLTTKTPCTQRLAKGWLAWLLLWPIATALSTQVQGPWANGLSTLSGAMLFLAGLTAPIRTHPSLWKYLGQLCYGMYITHWGFLTFLERLNLAGPAAPLARFTIVLLASAVLTTILQQVSWGRILLGQTPKAQPVPARSYRLFPRRLLEWRPARAFTGLLTTTSRP